MRNRSEEKGNKSTSAQTSLGAGGAAGLSAGHGHRQGSAEPMGPGAVWNRACYFWLVKGGFKVSSCTVRWYRSSYGTDSCNSEIASRGERMVREDFKEAAVLTEG